MVIGISLVGDSGDLGDGLLLIFLTAKRFVRRQSAEGQPTSVPEPTWLLSIRGEYCPGWRTESRLLVPCQHHSQEDVIC